MSDYAPYEDADDCIAQQGCELTRLRAREAALVEALTDCKTVLCESRRGEDLKTLTDAELGRLWTSLESKIDKALSNTDPEG